MAGMGNLRPVGQNPAREETFVAHGAIKIIILLANVTA